MIIIINNFDGYAIFYIFVSIRYSTSYHNKAICRREFTQYALFGGRFCFMRVDYCSVEI